MDSASSSFPHEFHRIDLPDFNNLFNGALALLCVITIILASLFYVDLYLSPSPPSSVTIDLHPFPISLPTTAPPSVAVFSLSSLSSMTYAVRSALVSTITKTWQIPSIKATSIVNDAVEAGRVYGLDPLLILGVVAQESGFHDVGNPGADREVIDPMLPHGLMQVAGKWHAEKFPHGAVVVTNDRLNILIGSQVLHEYLEAEDGDVARALQRYNGNLKDQTLKYASLVLKHRSLFMRSTLPAPHFDEGV